MSEIQRQREAAKKALSVAQIEKVIGEGFKLSSYPKDDTLSSSWRREIKAPIVLGNLNQEIAWDDDDGWIVMLWANNSDFHREARGYADAEEAIQGLKKLTEEFRSELIKLATEVLLLPPLGLPCGYCGSTKERGGWYCPDCGGC